jgi:hypothetical protein
MFRCKHRKVRLTCQITTNTLHIERNLQCVKHFCNYKLFSYNLQPEGQYNIDIITLKIIPACKTCFKKA